METKLTPEELLSPSQAEKLKELLEELLGTVYDAPRAMITFSQMMLGHPDPRLVQELKNTLRDYRFKHSELLRGALRQALPIDFPSVVYALSLGQSAIRWMQLENEARHLADRTSRILSALDREGKNWASIGWRLQFRAQAKRRHDADVSLLMHVRLVERHIRMASSILRKLKEFWLEYRFDGHPQDVDKELLRDLQTTWRMDEVLDNLSDRTSAVCRDMTMCQPSILPPLLGKLKYK